MNEIFGKLYSKEEADKLYGNVLESVALKKSEVEKLLSASPERILFNVINNKCVILNRQRETVYGTYTAKSEEVFPVYSTSKLTELLQAGGEEVTYFEKRKDKYTVTNGAVTLEESGDCPPNC